MGATLLLLAVFFCFIEGGIFSLPLTLCVLLCLMLRVKKAWVFIPSLLFGIILDILLFRDVGSTGLFFSAFLLLILLYERKFTIETYPFVIGVSGIFGALYALIFGQANFLYAAIVCIFLSCCLFFCTSFFVPSISEQKLTVTR